MDMTTLPTLCGQNNAPSQDVYTLIPETCGYVMLRGKTDMVDIIKVTDQRPCVSEIIMDYLSGPNHEPLETLNSLSLTAERYGQRSQRDSNWEKV